MPGGRIARLYASDCDSCALPCRLCVAQSGRVGIGEDRCSGRPRVRNVRLRGARGGHGVGSRLLCVGIPPPCVGSVRSVRHDAPCVPGVDGSYAAGGGLTRTPVVGLATVVVAMPPVAVFIVFFIVFIVAFLVR